MATPGGTTGACVGDLLLTESRRWDFFQAVRLWQRETGGRTAVGTGDEPDREALRFRTEVSFAFPTCEIAGMNLDEQQVGRADMTVKFMGVASPHSFGSLPTPYTEDVAVADRDRLPALHEFLDLFNHRFLSLFYRAWEKNRPPVIFERAAEGAGTLYETALSSLLGLADAGARATVDLPDGLLLGRAGQLRPGRTGGEDLVDLLEHTFGVTARVEQFLTRWFPVAADDCSRLGRRACSVGRDLVLGDQVPVAQSRFRIALGPLGWDEFREFLPSGPAHPLLHRMVELAAGPEQTFDVQLDLDAANIPELTLGAADEAAAPRLGWTTWLGSVPGRTTAEVVVTGGEPS